MPRHAGGRRRCALVAAHSLFSAQLPVKDWYQTFANGTLAGAILDRVVHGSYRLELGGPTRRDPKNGEMA